jgi:hypothetical protein
MKKYNLTSSDKKLLREMSESYMHGMESSDIIRLKKYLSMKNNKIKQHETKNPKPQPN